MTGKIVLGLLFLGESLLATPLESIAVQDLRLTLEHANQKIEHQSSELTLFLERLQTLENGLTRLKQELKISPSEKLFEKRISLLEKAHETVVVDLKTLKTHFSETFTTLTQCQDQLHRIDKQLTSDIQMLKTSLQSMLALLQPSHGERTYIVKPGDSLSLIALENKTDIKTLKKLNHLSSDSIFSGQKLILP